MKKKRNNSKGDLPPNIRERNGKFSYRYYIPTTKIVDGVEKKAVRKQNPPGLTQYKKRLILASSSKQREYKRN